MPKAVAKETGKHPAVRVLRQFQEAMNAWEWEMIRVDFSDLEEAEADVVDREVEKRYARQRQRLAKIFEKYCEKGTKAKRVRDLLHSGGQEPDYNPKTEKILTVHDRGDTVVVETKMAHNFQFKLRYELVRAGRKWLLRDNRKCMQDFQTKWSRWDL